VAALLFWFAWMPRKERLLPPLLTWEIYLARSTLAKYVGSVEAADADAAIEAATKEFQVKDPKRLIAVRRA
jgi:1,2-phenylacetyl-CoA epoxidase PaaB subunit